jgi:NAD(P)-dependent dehydrogenase (short-subunit alcohol dehydrogenase family)
MNVATPDLHGVRVLVTGLTDGLGLAMAQALVAAGAAVAVNGRRPERVEETVARLGGSASGSTQRPSTSATSKRWPAA